MATTEATLLAGTPSELAWTLVFDGYDLIYTTTSDTTGIATAYASTDWTTVKSGLQLIGQTQQSIDPFQPQIKPDSITFRVLDVDGTLAQLLLGNPSTVISAPLQETADPSDSTILAKPGTTGDFATSGTKYIGHEAFTHTSISSGLDQDTLGGTVVRGKYSLFGTDSGTRIGRRHVVATGTKSNRVTCPEIRTVPNAWYNRLVGLVLHHPEPNGSGTRVWSTATLPFSSANAQMIWSGRIKGWADAGDGWVEITCTSVHEMLRSSLWLEPYKAELWDGIIVTDANAVVHMGQEGTSTFGATTTLDGSGTFSTGAYRYDEIVSLIQGRFTANQPNGVLYGALGAQKWSIEVRETDQGPRVVMEVEPGSALAAGTKLFVGLSKAILDILGFGFHHSQHGILARKDGRIEIPPVDSSARTLYRLIAPSAPKVFLNPSALVPGHTVYVVRSEGTWQPQPTIPADSDSSAEGYIALGDRIFAATRSESVSVGGVNMEALTLVYSMQPATGGTILQEGGFGVEAIEPVTTVRQIWRETGKAGELLLKLMLSTGTSAYNHATYDVYGDGFGIGIPCDMVDVQSFESLDVQYELLLDSSEPFGDVLEAVLGVWNRHTIFEDGRLRLTPPGFDAPYADDIITMDEDSKAGPMDRSSVVYGTDGIINRIKLLYTTIHTAKRDGFIDIRRYDVPVLVADQSSESDYGHRHELEIKARGVLDPTAWAQYVAYPALAYFSRPMGVIRRSISARMFHLVPGDLVKITDDYLVDPTTGTRGVAGLACWVRSVMIDWAAMKGQVELLFLPTHPASRYALWAPSALVDHTADAGGYTNGFHAASNIVQLVAKTYGRSADSNDVAYFDAGDKVQIVEISAETPEESTATILSTDDANYRLTFTGAPSGTVTWDSAKRYIIEPRDFGNTVTAQQDDAFIADDAGEESTALDAEGPAKLWSGPYKGLLTRTGSIDYGTEFVRPGDSDAVDGEPLSSRKFYYLVKNLNNLLGYKTRNVLINEAAFPATRENTTTTYTLVWGPIWVPLYGTPRDNSVRRQLLGKVRLRVAAAGTCTVRIVSSASLVTGASDTAHNYSWASSAQTATSTSTTVEWVSLDAFSPVATSRNGQTGTWITGELKSSGGITAQWNGFALVEAAL
jgi:hypothetical protein